MWILLGMCALLFLVIAWPHGVRWSQRRALAMERPFVLESFELAVAQVREQRPALLVDQRTNTALAQVSEAQQPLTAATLWSPDKLRRWTFYGHTGFEARAEVRFVADYASAHTPYEPQLDADQHASFALNTFEVDLAALFAALGLERPALPTCAASSVLSARGAFARDGFRVIASAELHPSARFSRANVSALRADFEQAWRYADQVREALESIAPAALYDAMFTALLRDELWGWTSAERGRLGEALQAQGMEPRFEDSVLRAIAAGDLNATLYGMLYMMEHKVRLPFTTLSDELLARLEEVAETREVANAVEQRWQLFAPLSEQSHRYPKLYRLWLYDGWMWLSCEETFTAHEQLYLTTRGSGGYTAFLSGLSTRTPECMFAHLLVVPWHLLAAAEPELLGSGRPHTYAIASQCASLISSCCEAGLGAELRRDLVASFVNGCMPLAISEPAYMFGAIGPQRFARLLELEPALVLPMLSLLRDALSHNFDYGGYHAQLIKLTERGAWLIQNQGSEAKGGLSLLESDAKVGALTSAQAQGGELSEHESEQV